MWTAVWMVGHILTGAGAEPRCDRTCPQAIHMSEMGATLHG